MTIRPSAHTGEYILAETVKNPGEVPTGYVSVNPTSKGYVNEFGVFVQPEASYSLLSATGVSGTDELRTVVTTVVKGSRTYTNTITYSEVRMIPVTWVNKCVQGGITLWEESWLVVGNESGTGAAMQVNERYIERNGESDYAHHNPNQGGAGHSIEYTLGDPVDSTMRRGGIPIYYATSGNEHKAACHPPDFGGDPDVEGIAGSNFAGSDKGQTETSAALWFGHRFFQHVTPNFGGDACSHKTNYWTYSPREWRSTRVSAPLVAYRVTPIFLRDRLFDEAYVRDLQSGVSTAVANWEPPSISVDWAKSWTASMSRLQTPAGSSAWSKSAYMAIIFRDSSTDMTIAVAAKLEPTNSSNALFTSEQIGSQNCVAFFRILTANVTGTVTTNQTSAIAFLSKTELLRPVGWIGSNQYIVIGTQADVLDSLSTLYSSGELDVVPAISDMPSIVTDGTVTDRVAAGLEPQPLSRIKSLIRLRWERTTS